MTIRSASMIAPLFQSFGITNLTSITMIYVSALLLGPCVLARARRRRRRGADASARVRAHPRARRVHLIRVHPRPCRRHRGDDRSGDRSLGTARDGERDDQGSRHEAGLPAIEELTRRGVNVNVTLLFSVERYERVIDAYVRGLAARATANEPVDEIASVASFFCRASTARWTPSSRTTRRCVARSRSRVRGLPTSVTCGASKVPIGQRSSAWAPTGNCRCAQAPAPRIPTTRTFYTSPSWPARTWSARCGSDDTGVRRPRRGRPDHRRRPRRCRVRARRRRSRRGRPDTHNGTAL